LNDRLEKRGHWVAFFAALVMSLLVFLPFIIYNKGMFLYYGDFNVQQIPFYQHVHDAIRAGAFGWDPITDLGVNLLGSYSFYNLFSPFFWLTIPFPSSAIPYLMAPLLILKTACAAFTSYFYIARFVRDRYYAVLGSLLYAFSGFMTYNIFFNHFHEATLFFPLMLIGLEELLQNRRRGMFAAAVALCAVVNYWFFIGEVVFVILYFFVRTLTSEDCRFTWGRLLHTLLEGVLGVGLAAVVFVPSVLAILGNPRTGVDSLINGWGMWYYSNPQRYLAILHSLFFPPDLSSLPNFFMDHGAKWASLAAYLPMVGVCGVLAWCRGHRDSWLRRMLVLCGLMAVVPVLNAAFVLFNNSYYARWYYMPILLMCAVSAMAMEDEDTRWDSSLLTGLWIVAGIAVITGLTPKRSDGAWHFGLEGNAVKMWLSTALALAGLILAGVVLIHLRRRKDFKKVLAASLCAASVVYSIACVGGAVSTFHNNSWIVDKALAGRGNISLPSDGTFSRVDFYEGDENMGLYWEIPSIQAFHSIVPVSIMEFYPEIGVTRDVSSKPEADKFALRPLFSVRWLFVDEDANNQTPMPGYSLYNNQYGYNVYENQNYLPMGFSFDSYITQDQWEQLGEGARDNALLKGLLLDDKTIDKVSDLMKPIEDDVLFDDSDNSYKDDVKARKAEASSGSVFEHSGYTCKCNYSSDRVLFFSVPYDKGWSATVNGQTAEILQADVGFMAVRVPAGECTVRLQYHTPGLRAGLGLSLVSLALLAAWARFGGRLTGPAAPAAAPAGEAAPAQTPDAGLPQKDETEGGAPEQDGASGGPDKDPA